MSNTPNLELPLIAQNAKQLSPQYNESMQIVDVLLQLITQAIINDPPVTVAPADLGKRWAVGAAPTGAWIGHAGDIAVCTAAEVWEFHTPQIGWLINRNLADGFTYSWNGTTWAQSVAGGTIGASSVTYDNAASGLASTNAQDAIDELESSVDTVASGVTDALAPTEDVSALAIVAGVVDIDCALGNLRTLELTGNVTSITFSNLPAAGKGQSIAIRIKQDATGGRTVAFPASFKAIGGTDTAVPSTANAYALLTITTFDQGTRWEYAMQEIA